MVTNFSTKGKENRRLLMFRYGIDEFSVAKFLKQSKANLTKAGAKGIGNIPDAFTHRAAFLSKLPLKCDQIISDWFKKNPLEGEIEDLNKAFEVLSKSKEGFDHSLESSRKMWRTIFVNFISIENYSTVNNFLIGKSPLKQIESKAITPEKLLIKEILVKDKDKKIKLTAELSVTNSKKQDLNVVTKNTLPNNSLVGENKHIKSISEVQLDYSLPDPQINNTFGFIYSDAQKLDSDFKNIGVHEPVLGEVKTIWSKNQFFINIKGIIFDTNLKTVTDSEALQLFPNRGGAVGFSERIFHFSPVENLLAVWQVHDQENDKSTRFIIDSCVNIVLDVVDIPHSSLEPDFVREWLKNIYISRPGLYPVFQLKDGIILRAQALVSDFKTHDFTIPFLAYYNHEAINWNGRRIVIKQFPAPSFKYECVSIEIALKRLFKFKSEVSDFPKITNKNIQDLAYLVAKEVNENFYSNSYKAISERITGLFAIKGNIDILLGQIIQTPEIQLRINKEISEEKQRFLDELLNEKEEISRLKIQKKLLDQEITKSSSLVSRSIKKAFDDAVTDGIKTITEVALLKPFLASTVSSSIEESALASIFQEFLSSKTELTDSKGLMGAIQITCLEYALKPIVVSLFIAASLVRGVVGVYGAECKKLIQAVASITSGGAYSSISISVDKFCFNDLLNLPVQIHNVDCNGFLFGSLLDTWQKQNFPLIVELRGFNRMPPESIITEILDNGNFLNYNREFIWNSPSGEVKKIKLRTPIFFVLNFVYGKSTFPIPYEYASSIPLISNDLFKTNPLEKGLELFRKESYLGEGFIDNFLASANSEDGYVNLLMSMGFNEPESLCYSKLTLDIGRIDNKELLNKFSSYTDLLNLLDLNSLDSERAKFIFESI